MVGVRLVRGSFGRMLRGGLRIAGPWLLCLPPTTSMTNLTALLVMRRKPEQALENFSYVRNNAESRINNHYSTLIFLVVVIAAEYPYPSISQRLPGAAVRAAASGADPNQHHHPVAGRWPGTGRGR